MSEQYGKYELLNRIGRGGMAEVFLARQQRAGRFERILVIKRIRPRLADQQAFVDLFLEEARIAAHLDHPNVIPVYDLGEIDGSYFIAMPYVSGITIREAMKTIYDRGGRLPLDVCCEVLRQALSGLRYAHERQSLDGKPLELVHRDVTPSNLMVNEQGRVLLLDFGIATVVDSNLPSANELRGKLAYMSPEQVRGEGLDQRSDLFSLGIVFHEMLTNRRLFRRKERQEVAEAICREPIPSPRQVAPQVPPRIDAVAQRLLRRSRRSRYPTAALAIEELDAATEALGLEHGKPALLERFVAESFRGMLGEQHRLVQRAREGLMTAERDIRRALGAGSVTMLRARRRSTVILVTLLLLLVAGGGVLLGRHLLRSAGPTGAPLRFGVTPYLPEPVLRDAMAPLTRFIAERLDRPVRLVVKDSYRQTIDALLAGELDAADLTAYPYLLARRREPRLRALVTPTGREGGYRSLLVVRRSTIGNLARLRGKRICYVDRTSTSGYLMPRAMVRRAGFDPNRFFSSVQFSGDHHRALRDLLAGRCEVAALSSSAFETSGWERVKATRVVVGSQPLPPGVICASPQLAPSVAGALQRALRAFDPQRVLGRKSLAEKLPITSFGPVDEDAFAALARELGRAEGGRGAHDGGRDGGGDAGDAGAVGDGGDGAMD